MNFSKFLAAMEAAVPTIGQIVTIMHPENTAEGIKIAAGVQLFQIVAAGLHQIAAVDNTVAPVVTAQVAATPAAAVPAVQATSEAAAAPNV